MKLNQKIKDRIIDSKSKIIEALRQMDLIDKKLLLVFDASIFINVLSIGDIQRAILKGINLETEIRTILRENTKVAKVDDNFESIKTRMEKFRMELMPVIDNNHTLQ